MPYIVKGTMKIPERGSYTVEAETRDEAFEKADRLRALGLDVQITGPDGKLVETKNE